MYNKKKYNEILDCCAQDLNLVNSEIKSLLFENQNELAQSLNTFLFAKSKRLRPLIIFLIKDMLNVRTDSRVVKIACALELLHTATLIHDDIIDGAEKRRGLTSFNKMFNPKIATLAGDYLLSLCLKVLAGLNSPEIFSIFSQNTLKICTGEINQYFNKNKTVSIEEYILKSQNKTGALFLAGIQSLLCLVKTEATVPRELENAILNYVEKFSLAFQIYDDIENFQNANTEKSASDFENGIYTLPWLFISQQNKSCDIIEYEKLKGTKIYVEALKFSNDYLKNVLNKAIDSLKPFDGVYKINLPVQLAEIFKNETDE